MSCVNPERRGANMFLWLFFAFACSDSPPPSTDVARPVSTQNAAETVHAPRVIILGDSLTAGLGLAVDQAYPALLANQLANQGLPTEIINAGVSGDTTAGGLRRVDWLLKQKPDLLVIELGANDGMRGAPVEEVHRNLAQIIDKSKAAGVETWLMQMMVPPNYGVEYADSIRDIYPALAAEKQVKLLPFLLQDVAGKAELNQADGIHPTSQGQVLMEATLRPYFQQWRSDLNAQSQ